MPEPRCFKLVDVAPITHPMPGSHRTDLKVLADTAAAIGESTQADLRIRWCHLIGTLCLVAKQGENLAGKYELSRINMQARLEEITGTCGV